MQFDGTPVPALVSAAAVVPDLGLDVWQIRSVSAALVEAAGPRPRNTVTRPALKILAGLPNACSSEVWTVATALFPNALAPDQVWGRWVEYLVAAGHDRPTTVRSLGGAR